MRTGTRRVGGKRRVLLPGFCFGGGGEKSEPGGSRQRRWSRIHKREERVQSDAACALERGSSTGRMAKMVSTVCEGGQGKGTG